MAGTVDSNFVRTVVDRIVNEVQLSVLNSGATETITLNAGTPALYPTFTRMTVVTGTTSGDPVYLAQGTNWTAGGANSGRTVTVKLSTIPAGDLTGAVVKLYFEWLESGSGGISA